MIMLIICGVGQVMFCNEGNNLRIATFVTAACGSCYAKDYNRPFKYAL